MTTKIYTCKKPKTHIYLIKNKFNYHVSILKQVINTKKISAIQFKTCKKLLNCIHNFYLCFYTFIKTLMVYTKYST